MISRANEDRLATPLDGRENGGRGYAEAARMLTFIFSWFRQFSVTDRIGLKLRVKSRVKLDIEWTKCLIQ